jgi:hypothetical protein
MSEPIIPMSLSGPWILPNPIVVPGDLMPSGTTYTVVNGQIMANAIDASALVGLNFLPSVIDCGVLGQ